MKKVWFDVGHGMGNRRAGVFDPGATCWYRLRQRLEHGAALWLVKRVVRKLQASGVPVFVTKSGRYTKRAGRAHAAGCDFGVSVHFNGGAASASGFESFIHPKAGKFSHNLQSRVHAEIAAVDGLPDRGKKEYGYAVLAGVIPAVLLEIAFMNPHDFAIWLVRRDAIATALAKAVYSIAKR